MLSWKPPRGHEDGSARIHIVKPIFKFLTGDVDMLTYGGKLISQRMCNGEFYFWLVAEIIPWEEHGCKEEIGATYGVEVKVVSPSEAGEKGWKEAVDSCGWTEEDLAKMPLDDPAFRVQILSDYGIGAIVWQENGNNIKKLWRKMHKDLAMMGITFGFDMDRNQNKIGSSGWDMLKGDVLAGLYRYSESDSDEKKLTRKMYGLPESLEDAQQAVKDGSATLKEDE